MKMKYTKCLTIQNPRFITRPPRLSESTQIVFNMELTHLGSEAFNCCSFCLELQFSVLQWSSEIQNVFTCKLHFLTKFKN